MVGFGVCVHGKQWPRSEEEAALTFQCGRQRQTQPRSQGGFRGTGSKSCGSYTTTKEAAKKGNKEMVCNTRVRKTIVWYALNQEKRFVLSVLSVSKRDDFGNELLKNW